MALHVLPHTAAQAVAPAHFCSKRQGRPRVTNAIAWRVSCFDVKECIDCQGVRLQTAAGCTAQRARSKTICARGKQPLRRTRCGTDGAHQTRLSLWNPFALPADHLLAAPPELLRQPGQAAAVAFRSKVW